MGMIAAFALGWVTGRWGSFINAYAEAARFPEIFTDTNGQVFRRGSDGTWELVLRHPLEQGHAP